MQTRIVRAAFAGLGAFVVGTTACDLPTAVPMYQTTWIVPALKDSLSVSTLLPAGVTLANGGTSFSVSVAPTTINQTLGGLCGATCTAINGLSAPKPAFSTSVSSTVTLPASTASVVLAAGSTIRIDLLNNLGFDLIKPTGASSAGKLVTTLSVGSTIIGTDSLDSNATSGGNTVATGATTTRNITLTAGATINGPITVGVAIVSPAGGITTLIPINTANAFRITATVVALNVASATVAVANQNISQTTDLSLGLDSSASQHAQGATVTIVFTNPFQAGGTLSVAFKRPNGTSLVTAKTLTLAPATSATPLVSTSVISLSAAEMKVLAGADSANMVISGGVTAPGGSITVTPTQVIKFSTQLKVIIGATKP